MKFTPRQLKDLETIIYFMPSQISEVEITDEDKQAFFAISERGIYPEIRTKGLEALLEGKRWRGIHMFEMYEPGILDGTMPYYVILGGADIAKLKPWYRRWFSKRKYDISSNPIPRSVVDFMKKELFKGEDAELIEEIYQSMLQEELKK